MGFVAVLTEGGFGLLEFSLITLLFSDLEKHQQPVFVAVLYDFQ